MVLRLLLVILFLGLILGGIFGWKHYQQQQAAMGGPPPSPVVAVAQVQQEDWQPRLTAIGSLIANQGIFVTNEVSGQVREIHFESGQTVEKGDLLIQLDDSVDQADLKGLIAQSNLAQIKLRRFAKLLKDRSASQSEYDEAKAELDGADAAVAAKEAAIDKKRIAAPFDGKLGIRIVDLGEYLPPGSQIVPLEALDPIFVDYALPEHHLPRIAVGKQVVVKVAAYPNREFQGTIDAINPGVEEKTRTVKVRATLENPQRLLRPGMFAEVSTLLPAREKLLTLPRIAITFAPYGDTVFLIEEQDDQNLVHRRQVTTGQVHGGRVEILEGLTAGDRVVMAGQVKLRNGQPVQIDNSVVPPADAPMGP
ncbi:MAG: efflux RND transporter periplasmic adaptor subunit [Pseudomonadota bacterium]|nr:efflux RND transporter periplasmic adaptor subunit [Pseudomonadota bacterium]